MDELHTAQRIEMVEDQLRRRGIRDERVLAAMETVPRHAFVPKSEDWQAYDDHPLVIAEGQTISQPYVVAYTLEAARITQEDSVLDVGTGSGYAAAVASLLAARVVSVERHASLAANAAQTLSRLGYTNVTVHTVDGTLGLPGQGPYDVIVAAAAGPEIPAAWMEQTSPGGRIVAPVGPREDQILVRLTRTADGWKRERLLDVRYVPLIGEHGY